MGEVSFEIVIDESLSHVTTIDELKALTNKRILSLINDFEEGSWRSPKFLSYIWDNVALTALSQKERAALVNQAHTSLVSAAKNLRLTDKDTIGPGSEIAEIFLYGMMRDKFNALPVVPKIFYKQNVNDNAKGADSVHVVVNGDDFTLWFGEAKFYNSIEDARLDAVVTSVCQLLIKDKLRKENSIIMNVADLNHLGLSDDLLNKIKQALEPKESIDSLKSKIHVPILLLHECEITASQTSLSEPYRAEIRQFHKTRAEAYFKKQLAKAHQVHNYEQIKFHLILFPVPEKKPIVDAFVTTAAHLKGSG